MQDEKALNFIYRSRNETEKADIDQLMEYSRLYFSQDFVNDTGFKNYDAAILMTGYISVFTYVNLQMYNRDINDWL